MTRLVLLPSPLLGPGVWEPVAEVLRARGWSACVAQPSGHAASPEQVLGGFLAAVPDEPGLVLVPHSNAGRFAAAIAAERQVAAAVFVDASLPARVCEMASPELVAHLRTLVDPDGLLPPWTRWWPEQDVAELFPDTATRGRVEAEQPRLPLTYFSSVLTGAGRWEGAAGYLAFGEGYAAERDAAVERGWPVRTLRGKHLHMLVAPDEVGAAVEGLLGELAVGPG